MTSIFAVCMMLFVSAACFAKSPKAYYKVDSFSDITGTWEAEQDGEKAKLIITKKCCKVLKNQVIWALYGANLLTTKKNVCIIKLTYIYGGH